VCFSPDGQYLATSSADKTAILWDAESGDQIRSFQHTTNVSGVAFSPDGRMLVTASNDGTARLWNVDTGEQLSALKGHASMLFSAAFRQDGKLLATCGTDQNVKVWDVAGRSERFTFEAGPARMIAFTPDGRQLAVAGLDGRFRLFAVSNPADRLVVRAKSYQESIAFSPDGKRFAVGCLARSGDRYTALLEVRNTVTGDPEWKSPSIPIESFKGSIDNLSFTPDGQRLAAGLLLEDVGLWDLSGRQAPYEFSVDMVGPLAMSPDGKRIVTFSREHGGAVISHVDTGEIIFELEQLEDAYFCAAWSPNGSFIALARGRTHVWDARTGKHIHSLGSEPRSNWELVFSPDETRLYAINLSGTCFVWEMPTGELIHEFEAHDPNFDMISGTLSPDGKRLIVAGHHGTIRLWDTDTWQLLLSLEHPGHIRGVAISQDGRTIGSVGSFPGVAAIWPAFPWKEADYPGDASMPFQERLALYKRDYWRNRPEETEYRSFKELSIDRETANRASELNKTSWNVVMHPGRTPEEYEKALAEAQEAHELLPDNGSILNTLGVAHYRVGKYAEALTTLQRSDRMNGGIPEATNERLIALRVVVERLGSDDKRVVAIDDAGDMLAFGDVDAAETDVSFGFHGMEFLWPVIGVSRHSLSPQPHP
jgi:WD40 repeat protein